MRGIQRSEQAGLLGFDPHDHTPLALLPLLDYPDKALAASIEESVTALSYALERGLNRWVLMYSGGKDSTALVILALEALRKAWCRLAP